MSPGVLVAGIGNILRSDDGFGVEVANRLTGRTLPEGVRVADFGIRGVHLAYELLDGYQALVLIDAVPMQEPPGTVALIEPDLVPVPGTGDDAEPIVDAHSMGPELVLRTLRHLGGDVERVVVVGCQPASLDDGIGLSPPVAAAVDEAVEECIGVIDEMCQLAGREKRG